MGNKEYGGYLPLEIQTYKGEYYKENNFFNVVKLNSGRSTFFFSAKLGKIKRIYLPYFTCEETKTPFINLGIKVENYLLDDELLPKGVVLKDDDYMFWTNYYGNASKAQINKISSKYKNLIIDNCHAFFTAPLKGAFNCYSTRKFFGVSDGAYLINDNLDFKEEIPRDTSFESCSHLIKQLDLGVNAGYKDSLKNESRLCEGFKSMSKFTQKILESIDYKRIQQIRNRNFNYMHSILGKINQFPINIESKTHMYYPFLIDQYDLRYKLISSKIYNPFWWEHVLKIVPKNSIEYKLAKYTVMLPIDQRYNEKDISTISKIVISHIS
tara:strand:+ start:203 stop:1177 length:975 start_codon:yes stop_codon:yes gene_type:complete